ncbi:MAG: mismatch-specific glycosylase [Firmicutes bacterium]|nr:mismatch-specific glycosylase [Bacillota bacterium]
MERIEHPFPPLFDQDSKVLVLGSFPSVKSREAQFFYHHPQNRFWKVISLVFDEPVPNTIDDKRALLLRNKIALWDVIQSCEIVGSADSSIKNAIANDLSRILKNAQISWIITNGNTSYQLYMKYIYPVTGIEAHKLPSTSPANASFSLERLVQEWSVIRTFI